MYAIELSLEKITEDAAPYRDTILLVADDSFNLGNIEQAIRQLAADNDMDMVELAMEADRLDWSGTGLTPAGQARDTFLDLVDLVPSSTAAFGNITYAFIDIDDF